jgi:hypothetical protein
MASPGFTCLLLVVKNLRDFLIVVVLGSVVIGAVVTFVWNVHSASVAQSVIVQEAEVACILDGVICHAGYEQFSSEEDARAYLKSPEHLAAEKARKDDEARMKK